MKTRMLSGTLFFFVVLVIVCSSDETEESLTSESPGLRLIQQIEKEAKILADGWKQLKTEKNTLKREKNLLVDGVPLPTDLIRLNVGGELFVTRRKLLRQVPRSKFATLFNGRWEKRFSVDLDGNLFFDVHPKVFRHFLEQLRINEDKATFTFSPLPHPSPSIDKAWRKFCQTFHFDLSKDSSSSDVLLLNVQGRSMLTHQRTIQQSKLATIIQRSAEQMKSTNFRGREHFLDVHPRAFGDLLERVRWDPRSPPPLFAHPSNEQQRSFNRLLKIFRWDGLSTPVRSTHLMSEKTLDQGSFAGEIRLYSSSNVDPPSNWLRCDGATVSRLVYPKLFQVIGNTFDVENRDSTMFQLPDLRGRFPLGRDSVGIRSNFAKSIGQAGGNAEHQLMVNELPSHSHQHGTLKTNRDGQHQHSIDDPGHSHSATIPDYRPFIDSFAFFGLFGHAREKGYRSERTNGTYYRRGGIVEVGSERTGIRVLTDGEHSHSIEGTTDLTGRGEKYSLLNPFLTFDFLIFAG